MVLVPSGREAIEFGMRAGPTRLAFGTLPRHGELTAVESTRAWPRGIERLDILDAERAREEERLGLGKRARSNRGDDDGEAPSPPKTSQARK
jgi:hypothetical protein